MSLSRVNVGNGGLWVVLVVAALGGQGCGGDNASAASSASQDNTTQNADSTGETKVAAQDESPATDQDPTQSEVAGVNNLDESNLVADPSFESGPSGWTAAWGGTLDVSTDQAHSGSQSIRVTERTDTYQGPHFNLVGTVNTGASYAASAYALLGGATSDDVKLTVTFKCDGQEDAYIGLAADVGSDSEWTELSGTFDVPSVADCSLQSGSLYVEGPAGGVDLFIDDVSLVETAPPSQEELGLQEAAKAAAEEIVSQDGNLIANPDFEAGGSGWSAAWGGSFDVTTEQAHGGSQSGHVSDRSETYQGAHYDLTSVVMPGASYKATAFGMIGGASSDNLMLSLRLSCDGLDDAYANVATVTGSDSEWMELSGSFDIPGEADCSLVDALLYMEGPAAGVDIFIDDVSVIAQ